MITCSKEVDHLLRHSAERSYPEESCGMLLGSECEGVRHVHEAIEIPNSQDVNRETRFLINPEQYLRAEKVANEKRLQLLGWFHSHPDHPATPSQFDTEHAMPWFVYMIISVRGGRSERITAWELSQNRQQFEEKLLRVEW